MNTTSNSLGSELIGEAGFGETDIRRTSVTAATKHEMTRAVLALRLYELQNGGTAAPDLSTLVKNREIPSLPIDLFQLQPLKYDPKRQLVYSLGPLGIDEASKLRGDGWTPNRTLGFFVAKPN